MASRHNYSESDMRRMQQDAVNRVQEMQSRARYAADEANRLQIGSLPPPPSRENQGWSTSPNIRRQGHSPSQQPNPSPPPAKEEDRKEAPFPPPLPPPEPESPPTPKNTTLIEDILGVVGLDDDRVLIIGLVFILINAKADTTLILALMYLLL